MDLEHERLGCHDPLVSGESGLPAPEHERPDAVGVAEREEPVPRDEGDRRVRAFDALMQARDGAEHLVGVEVGAGDLLLQLVGEDVDEQLGIARGVEVAAVDIEEFRGQLACVREVAVVDERDAVRGIHVERLRLLFVGRAALGGVAHVPEAHVAQEAAHVTRAVRLAHLALGLLHVQGAAVGGRDARRILSAVLQQQERVVGLLVDRLG